MNLRELGHPSAAANSWGSKDPSGNWMSIRVRHHWRRPWGHKQCAQHYQHNNHISTVACSIFFLTFISTSIPNIFPEYNQQDTRFHNLFISVRRSTCFRRVFCPSSVAQNCTYSVRYLSDQYLTLYVQFWTPDDGRKNRLKHAERLTEINKLWNIASCWLYSANSMFHFVCC